ncbi:hypothetical protein C0J52_11298 [Blattella germanica]|nr:hypothetical protein C0J52_11298 [Blattella germanica]
MAVTVFTLETNQSSRPEELHTKAATYSSNRRQIPGQQIIQTNSTVDKDKEPRTTHLRRATQYFGSRINNKINLSSSKNAASIIDPNKSEDERINEESLQRPTSEEGDTMMMAGAGRRKNSKSKRGDDDDDDEKTLSQQIADGKYGLIEKEIYATTPKRPGIVSYASNPEVPRDNAKNLGGLDPEEIWLAENHVLVLRGGFFPEHKFNRTDDTATAWPPIDSFNAPPRQVKIPANPKVPPPFPVQLTDDGPTQFIGFNGTQGRPPFPPFFPQPPPGNGSYFAPPFPFPPPGNFTPGFYPPIPPGNFTPGGGIYPPPGNGSFYPPPFPFPLPPPRNGSYFAPPPGNFTPGSGPFYPPPFPGFPFPPPNGTFRPLPPGIFPPPLTPNGTLPFPPNFFQNLPPGAAFLPPPGNLTELFDEDDPSLYYPPPYDFYYPQDNSTEVPPGPLVPGIVLPPPPNFFAPLNNKTDEQTNKHSRLPTTTEEPPTRGSPHRTYLPANRQQVAKGRRPSISYLPVTNDLRKRKPRPPIATPDNDDINHVTPKPDVYVLTTPVPEKSHDVEYNKKPPRPLINIAPQNVQVTHQGSSRLEPSPPKTYYDEPAYVITRPPETIYINNGYSKVISDIVTTPLPGVTYYTAPVTDIEVQPIPKHQQTGNNSKPNTSSSPTKEPHTYELSKEPNISQKQNSKHINTPTTTLTPLFIFYTPRQQDIETNRVTPPPEPYYMKAQGGVTATLPPVLYYTVPSAGKPKEPTSVKTSFYFYEEPREEQVRHDSPITTQIPPSTFEKPITGYQYNSNVPPIPPARGRGGSKKMPPQYTIPEEIPLSNSKEEDHKEPESETPPTETPIKTVTQNIRPQIYTTSAKVSARPQQYIYSDVVPVGQVKGGRQRSQAQPYILSSILPVGKQAVYPTRSKLPYASTPAPPQYYYVTASPGLQYNIVGSSTPSVINQQYPSQLSQQGYVKSTPQPSPIISNLAYFSTPRPDIVFQDVVSSERPILYNIQPSPSPRPIYQYSFESNKNTATQQPLRQTAYTTPRPKTRPVQKINYSGNSQGPVLLPVQYQTTPRTLFEYSYEQQGLSTAGPEIQGYYSAVGAHYDEPEDVTAGSPTTHYGYDSREQNQQSQSYQSTPRPKYNRYQNPSVPQVHIYPTANPLHAYFTRQDETLLDDITKKYFTIFGQKLQGGEENGPTTPIPSYANRNEQQTKQTNTVNRDGQHYTTPAPNYNYQTAERPSGSDNRGPIPLADDINVNYKKPLPPINPYSEFVDTRQWFCDSDSEFDDSDKDPDYLPDEENNQSNLLHNEYESSAGSKINTPQSLTVPQNDADYPSNGDDSSPGNDDVIGRGRKRKRNINIQNTCQIKRNRDMSYTNRRGKSKLVEAVN